MNGYQISSRTGPRGPVVRLFWLSATGALTIMVRRWSLFCSLGWLGVNISSHIQMMKGSPAPVVGSLVCRPVMARPDRAIRHGTVLIPISRPGRGMTVCVTL